MHAKQNLGDIHVMGLLSAQPLGLESSNVFNNLLQEYLTFYIRAFDWLIWHFTIEFKIPIPKRVMLKRNQRTSKFKINTLRQVMMKIQNFH